MTLEEGGGGVWDQKFLCQKWPESIFPFVNFSHDGHFGLGGGGGLWFGLVWFGLVWLAPGPWPRRLKVSEGLRHGAQRSSLPAATSLAWRFPAHGVCPCRDSLPKGLVRSRNRPSELSLALQLSNCWTNHSALGGGGGGPSSYGCRPFQCKAGVRAQDSMYLRGKCG